MSLFTGNSYRLNSLYALLTKGGARFKAFTVGNAEIVTAAGQNLAIDANAVVIDARPIMVASTAQVVAAGTTIQPNAAVVQLSSSGAVTMTSTPTIAPGINDQQLLLQNVDTADAITIQDNGTLADSDLRLVATTVVLGPLDSVLLRYIESLDKWVQVGATTNVV